MVSAFLTGRVYQDLGQGVLFTEIDWVKQTFQEKLGFAPYPGTLNLLMEDQARAEWRRLKRQWAGIDIPPGNASFCRSRCFRVLVEGKIQGAVVVPEVKDYPEEKLEILAPVHVKETLNVKDGDVLTIEVFES
jgi:CTP-dependent riboflavin kinase